MKKTTILLTCLLVATFAFSQAKKVSFEDLSRDVNNQSVSAFSLNGELFTGSTYDEYDEAEICREVVIVRGFIQKETGWYYDGKKEREFNYKNGFLDGKAFMYHRSGNIFAEDNYLDGELDGKQYRYNCDGSLRAEWDSVSGMALFRVDFEKKKCIGKCRVDDGC